MNIKRGVYFLANNRTLELSIAFLNSFRKFNPNIHLCLIPYNSDYKNIAEFQKEFNFIIFDDERVLEICDNISLLFPSPIPGAFRKLAMWEGPFLEFIYIDVDTIVLTNLDFVFDFLSDYDFITSHSSIPDIRKWVWKDSIYNTDILSKEQIDYAANTGFIVSHKNAFSMTSVQNKINMALRLKEHMELLCGEQPLFNYLFVTTGKYISLFSLYLKNTNNKIPLEQWAGEKNGVIFRGKIYFPKKNYPILLVHWTGMYNLTNFEIWVYNKLYKFFGIKKKMDKIGFFMPYKRLWKYYRFMKKKIVEF